MLPSRLTRQRHLWTSLCGFGNFCSIPTVINASPSWQPWAVGTFWMLKGRRFRKRITAFFKKILHFEFLIRSKIMKTVPLRPFPCFYDQEISGCNMFDKIAWIFRPKCSSWSIISAASEVALIKSAMKAWSDISCVIFIHKRNSDDAYISIENGNECVWIQLLNMMIILSNVNCFNSFILFCKLITEDIALKCNLRFGNRI